jgi:uncharacterized protein YjdB
VYQPILVTGITIAVDDTALEVEDNVYAQLRNVTPSNALNQEVAWVSSNSSVATIDSQGLITAVAGGTTQIYAVAKDGSGVTSNKVTITVTAPVEDTDSDDEDNEILASTMILTGSVKNVKTTPLKGTYELSLKKSLVVTASFLPENAEPEDIEITSSNKKVAAVSGNKIVAKKAGTATITVESDNGLKQSFKVKVMASPVSKIKIKAAKKVVKVNKTITLKAITTPSKKTASAKVFWKSSNTKVATVSTSGKVKGVKKGKVKITAYATDGSGKKATITIKVK